VGDYGQKMKIKRLVEGLSGHKEESMKAFGQEYSAERSIFQAHYD
jgi:hypothetical protein